MENPNSPVEGTVPSTINASRKRTAGTESLLINTPAELSDKSNINVDLPDDGSVLQLLTDSVDLPVLSKGLGEMKFAGRPDDAEGKDEFKDNTDSVASMLSKLMEEKEASTLDQKLSLPFPIEKVTYLDPFRQNCKLSQLQLDVKQISLRNLKTSFAYQFALLEKQVSLAVDDFIVRSAAAKIDGSGRYDSCLVVPVMQGWIDPHVTNIVDGMVNRAFAAVALPAEVIDKSYSGSTSTVRGCRDDVFIYKRRGADASRFIIHVTRLGASVAKTNYVAPTEGGKPSIYAQFEDVDFIENHGGFINGRGVIAELATGENVLGKSVIKPIYTDLGDGSYDASLTEFKLDPSSSLIELIRCGVGSDDVMTAIRDNGVDTINHLQVADVGSLTRVADRMINVFNTKDGPYASAELQTILRDYIATTASEKRSIFEIDNYISGIFGILDPMGNVPAPAERERASTHDIVGQTLGFDRWVFNFRRDDDSMSILRMVENDCHINELGEIIDLTTVKYGDLKGFPKLYSHRYSSKKLRTSLKDLSDVIKTHVSLHFFYSFTRQTEGSEIIIPSANASVGFEKIA